MSWLLRLTSVYANKYSGKFRELQRLTVQYARVLGMDKDDEENVL